jgi:CheY-like chemotaxis protein
MWHFQAVSDAAVTIYSVVMTDTALFENISPKRVLVVDDATTVPEAVHVALAHLGHQVEIASDGAMALKMFQPGKYDLVITDYLMPNLDGVQLAHSLKRQAPALPILLLSGYTSSIVAEHPEPLPVDFVLAKPFSMKELQQALAVLFPTDGRA